MWNYDFKQATWNTKQVLHEVVSLNVKNWKKSYKTSQKSSNILEESHSTAKITYTCRMFSTPLDHRFSIYITVTKNWWILDFRKDWKLIFTSGRQESQLFLDRTPLFKLIGKEEGCKPIEKCCIQANSE